MINERIVSKTSRFLILILRHKPEGINIQLDEHGWVNTEQLIKKSNEYGHNLTMDILEYIVETNDKKRFAFNDDKTKIRASQGHSVDIELGYTPKTPPTILYHGTGLKSVFSIQKFGIEKRSRTHVHLSSDIETAITVGKRHGNLVVFEVQALKMHCVGYKFFLSDNGVWLTDWIPVPYIRLLPSC